MAKKTYRTNDYADINFSDVQKVYVTNGESGGAPTEHNHDDLYYRQSEVDSQIASATNGLETEQYKVKASSTDSTADYLNAKVDTVTVDVVDDKLVVKNIDGLTIGVADINGWLSGTSGNIQDQIDNLQVSMTSITSGMNYLGKFETKADLNAVTTMENGDVAVVIADESREGGRSLYVYSEDIGAWDFIGEFTFADEFIELQDTPNSYVGHDGKVVKVDEVNGKVIFSTVDYSELSNAPTSSVADIDDAVQKRHSHANKSEIDRIGIDANGNITVDGVTFVQHKQMLYARRIGSGQNLPNGSSLVFNTKVSGDIPYDETTGEFTLEEGKTYAITAQLHIYLPSEWTWISLVYSDTEEDPSEGGARITINAVNAGNSNNTGNVLSALITPASTRAFKLKKSDTQGGSNDSLVGNQESASLRIIEI